MELKTGLIGKKDMLVTDEMTAKHVGSGELAVFATPYLAALVESAAMEAIKECLSSEETTVGTKLSLSHVSATPVSMRVWAEAELTEIDRRCLSFHVSAYDEAGLIGEGTHERFVVLKDKFMAKTNDKIKVDGGNHGNGH